MNLKSKITLGLILLFGLLTLVSVLGILSINVLADDAREILKDNYVTLEHVQNMHRALDRLPNDPVSRQVFADNLAKQQGNITETGEQEATDALAGYFARLEVAPSAPEASGARQAAREQLFDIGDLNMHAIARKNDQAQQTAERFVAWLGIIATLCVLIAFSLLFNFPDYVVKPIRDFTDGIREIAAGNYKRRLSLSRDDEFGELATAFNELAAKLDAYEHSNLARLMFEKKRLETVIGALHDPVIGLNEDRLVLFANEPALALLNLPAKKLIGKDVREVALTNDLLRTILRTPRAEEPLKIFANDKESFFQPEILDISAPPEQPGAPAQPIGQVLFLKNITPFRERDLAKTNFIATISHELKTPLAAVKLGLRLLDDERVGPLNPEQHQLLRQLGDDANRLLAITGELLKLAQAETGNIQLTLAPADPHEIVDTASQALAAQAQEKNIRLDIQISTPDKIQALADADKAAWVLVNLLSNAVRHSPEGVAIEISVTRQGDFLRFAVRDRGPGVPAELQEKIFGHYFRAPGAPGNGTGLGLAISREFVRAMGGEIGVESTGGEGSTFWFTLRGQDR